MLQTSPVILLALLVSVAANAWMAAGAYRRWSWKRKNPKPAGAARAVRAERTGGGGEGRASR